MKVWFAGGDRAWTRKAIRSAGDLSLLQSFDQLKAIPDMKTWMAGAESKGYQEALCSISSLSSHSYFCKRDLK